MGPAEIFFARHACHCANGRRPDTTTHNSDGLGERTDQAGTARARISSASLEGVIRVDSMVIRWAVHRKDRTCQISTGRMLTRSDPPNASPATHFDAPFTCGAIPPPPRPPPPYRRRRATGRRGRARVRGPRTTTSRRTLLPRPAVAAASAFRRGRLCQLSWPPRPAVPAASACCRCRSRLGLLLAAACCLLPAPPRAAVCCPHHLVLLSATAAILACCR